MLAEFKIVANCVKTTFNLPEPLLVQAKALAAQRGTTVRAIVESGLRQVIEQSTNDQKPFKLRQASVSGTGLQAEAQGLSMSQLIDMSYAGRGS